MQDKERIVLDARVVSVIKDRVFCAELANGHTFVAYETVIDVSTPSDRALGKTVRVRMSPFDMSKGLVIDWPECEGD